MKLIKRTLVALALAGATAGAQQTNQITITPNVDVLSAYVSRGMIFGEGLSVEPKVTVNRGALTFQAWANRDKTLGWNELDLYAKAAKKFGSVNVEAAYGKFIFRNSALKETQEVSINANSGPANAFFVHDFREGKGSYAELAYDQAANTVLPLIGHVALGYNDHYFRPSSSFSHLEMKVTAPLAFKGTNVVPQVQYIKALSSNFQNKLVYGISVNKTF